MAHSKIYPPYGQAATVATSTARIADAQARPRPHPEPTDQFDITTTRTSTRSDMSSRYSSAELSEADPSEQPLGRTSEEEARAAVFNVDLLIARLEEYKFGLEETNRRVQRSKSTSPLDPPPYNPPHKEAAAVAAAARFRQEIERGATTSPPLSGAKRMFFDFTGDAPRDGGSSAMQSEHFPFPATTAPNETRTFPFPSPPTAAPSQDALQFPFPSPPEPPETAKNVPFPTRSSSIARRPSSLAARRRKAQPPMKANTTVQPQKEKERDKKEDGKLPTSGKVKRHLRSITVGDPRHSIASTAVATPAGLNFDFPKDNFSPGLQPEELPMLPQRSPLLMGSPMEDQIRRELEAMAILDGPELLEQSKRESGWRTPVVHVIELQEQEEDHGHAESSMREIQQQQQQQQPLTREIQQHQQQQQQQQQHHHHQQQQARTRARTAATHEPDKELLKATNRHAKIRRSNTHPQQLPATPAPASASVPATPTADTEDFVWRPHQEGGMARFGRFFMFRSFRRRQKTTAEDILDMYMSEEQIEEMKESPTAREGRGGRWGFR